MTTALEWTELCSEHSKALCGDMEDRMPHRTLSGAITRAPALAVLVVALLAGRFLSWAEDTDLKIRTPEDDLPSAALGDCRVDFTRNGAFVVSTNRRYLFDGGLIYATPQWTEWGPQIWRSAPDDSWALDSEHGTRLVTHGTLFDFRGNQRFTFAEQAETGPGALQLSYQITPLAGGELAKFGVVLHFPIAETAGAEATFWPGFRRQIMPAEFKEEALASGSARGVVIRVAGDPRAAVIGRGSMNWTLHDDRKWELNTFRLMGGDPAVEQALSSGKPASLSFEVLLGDAVAQRVPLGAGQCETDRYGRIALVASGRRIAEGGLAWKGEPLRWLHESSTPFVPPTPGPASRMTYTVTDDSGSELICSLGTRSEAGSGLTASYTARRPKAQEATREIELILAVPVSETVSTPRLQDLPGSPVGPASSGSRPRYAIQVAYRDGHVLELAAGQPWRTGNATVSDVECYLLCVPTETTEGEDLRASLVLHLAREQGPESEEHPR